MITHFYKRLSEYFKIYLLLLGVFLIFRVLFLYTYGNLPMAFQNFKMDLMKSFWHGFRCDTVVLCFALFPLVALNLIGFLFFFKQNLATVFHRFLKVFSKIYTILLFAVLFLVVVIDFFYYRNFQAHFDSRVFGIVEDGTKEVMASVWHDYPVIILILFFIVALFCWIKIVKKIQLQEKPFIHFNNIWAHIATVIISSVLLFLGARSSVSTFPFQKNDLAFSVNLRLNDAAANSVFMLKEAISEKMKHSLQIDVQNLLPAHGFQTLADAKKDWDSGAVSDSCSIFNLMKTPNNAQLESALPNIVLVIMEGWSSDFFNYHSVNFNLLGALEQELPHLIHYPFCFPVNYGTISALETFFTNNVGPALSLSEYTNIPLKSSNALAFKNAGYETSYYTGGYTGWRNVGKYARVQEFDNVRGAEYMKSLYPKTEEADWGVFDQYMFDAVNYKLQEESEKPQFFICMTITNHSPHKIPKHYKPLPLEIPNSFKARTAGDLQKVHKYMETFQYANDCLGKFLNTLRNSPLRDNTIVAITGDHALTGGFTYNSSEMLYAWAVPLMLYIPEIYAKNLDINTKRLVSHKDIIPTLFHLAFSDYSYRATGDNIFDAATADSAFVLTQSGWVLGKTGAINLYSSQSFSWQEGNYYLQPQENTPELEAMRKRANAWLFGMKWQIFSELK